MFTQKLYKNGNSIAVTIPKSYLKDLGVRDGSEVQVEYNEGMGVVVRKADNRKSAKSTKKSLFLLLKKVNEKYGDALQELAKK